MAGSVVTFHQPVRTIGGDFGLVGADADDLRVMVGDVSGHGIGSALVANRIYTEMTGQIQRGVELATMLRHLNTFVMHIGGDGDFFLTLAAARLRRAGHLLEFAGAGHPPAMILEPGERPRLLKSQSGVLGLLDNAVDHWPTVEVPMRAGDRLVLYTDGLTEAFNAQQEMLGVEGLGEIVREASTRASA